MILIATCTALMAVVAAASGLNVAQQQVALDLHASQSEVLWIINAYTVALAALLLPVGAIADRWSRKPVLIAGLVVFALASAAGTAIATAGLALIAALVSVSGGYLSVLPGMLLIGFGVGITMPLGTEAITASLPAERQGVASALNDITRELGGAIGVAVLGATLTAAYRSAILPALHGLPAQISGPASAGIGRAFAVVASQHDARQAHIVINAARHAFVHGWSTSIWIGAAGMFLLLLFLTARAPRSATSTASTPDREDLS